MVERETPHPAVRFSFQLQGALAERAPVGFWPHCPPGAVLTVDGGRTVTVSCRNLSEAFARHAVLVAAARFLRSIEGGPPQCIRATLEPANGESPISYAIALGSRVTIARMLHEPILLGDPGDELVAMAEGR